MSSKCHVKDGLFVEPCDALNRAADINTPSFTKAKGIAVWNMTNMNTGKPSRTYYGVKTKKHPNGLLFNCCPWCGERIDAPFAEENDTPEGEE